AHIVIKDYPAALDALDKASSIHGNSSDYITKKIDLLIKMDKTQAALVSIERALQENISDTSLYRYAAKIHRQFGDIDE
ncbi:MAG: hypothetical protein GWO08_23070, partial [Gammaproteobacteria bacterium]|nr:hypothetical protein [candidate division Zixibacteria bacterium]NIR96408.1 hypothetical protein [Gammaproteobacteria bacterium]NIS46653.1 hypothetical protein [candidate division Zixibacteria bacterium]NIU14778.1 hypothetical protein [candidate division Zixibacteria bacterium]NIV08348.1 hypothetical protein [candidate division Zixibacteria bacterium]